MFLIEANQSDRLTRDRVLILIISIIVHCLNFLWILFIDNQIYMGSFKK